MVTKAKDPGCRRGSRSSGKIGIDFNLLYAATPSKTPAKAANPPQDASEGSNPPTCTDPR
jgi:hypothetical protein